MIDGKRVVAWTPYGRKRTVSILAKYIRRDHLRGIIDEWWLCANTDPDQVEDIGYGMRLSMDFPHVIKWVERDRRLPTLHPKQRNTGYFYRQMTDPVTVYVRFDDDIVFVAPDAVERLVRHRLQTQVGVASFGLIWNNAICSYYLQKHGVVPEALGLVARPYCMDEIGWADGKFAVRMHHMLLDEIESGGDFDKLSLYQDVALELGQQFSVSFFASLGSMYAGLAEPGVLNPHEEESWHTVHEPRRLGQPNVIVGNALVSHYSFFPQQRILNATNILDRYRKVSENL